MGNVFQPIKQKRVSDEIVERIKEAIYDGKLLPGQKMPSERELAKSFNVSRMSLREALNTLQAQGLVEIQQGNRTFVRPVTTLSPCDPLVSMAKRSHNDIINIFEVRRFLEMGTAYMAAKWATKTDIKKLNKAYNALENDFKKGRLMAKSDFDFHQAIAAASHNAVFSHISQTLYDLLQEELRIAYGSIFNEPVNRSKLVDEHGSILEAIKKKDSDGAFQAAHDHLITAQQLWYAGLEKAKKNT